MSEIHGLEKIISNLNAEIRKLPRVTLAGLGSAGILIRRATEDGSGPLTPLKTGNLRGSWFNTPIRQTSVPTVIIGYTAEYAAKVHEYVDETTNWTRPGSGAKWFEAAIKRNTKNILEAIRKKAEIKKR